MRGPLSRIPFVAALLIAAVLRLAAPIAAAERFYQPPEGYVPAKQLPPDYRAVIRSITLDRRDAFDGTVAHSNLERKLYAFGNRIHVESRESTLKRRLLFREGGEVTADRLAETERVLRAEEFLSDAILAVKPVGADSCDIMVTTFDQWTTVPGGGLAVQDLGAADILLGRWNKLLDEEWFWWAGVSEANLFGTGTKVAAALRHDPIRDTRSLAFTNNNLTSQRLQVLAHIAWLSDGDSLVLKVNKPLLSREDRYAYGVTLTSQENSERFYLDANRFDELPDSVAEGIAKKFQMLRVYDRVATRQIEVTALRSFGRRLKFNVGPLFSYRDHYNHGGLGEADSAALPYIPIPASALEPEARTDALLGAAVSLYAYAYQTSRNFRNLKWSESVETGWRLTSKAALNQEWLGAVGRDWRLTQEAQYAGFWDDLVYVTAGASWQTFVSPSGALADGENNLWGEAALREHRLTATWLTASWSNLFASPQSRQLSLGELNGLSGYPSYYFEGQARFLATLEQRVFPEFEWLTMVPAFAAYFNAGNTFPAYDDFDPANLHYSMGLGLRLGRSKSTQKVVQHINVTFPLGDKYLSGPVVSVLAKKNL
jgi:hypothetical protein